MSGILVGTYNNRPLYNIGTKYEPIYVRQAMYDKFNKQLKHSINVDTKKTPEVSDGDH